LQIQIWFLINYPVLIKNYHFNYLSSEFKKVFNIDELNLAVYKTLGFFTNDQFNQGAALLSDNGSLEQSYIDIAKFKLDTSYFQNRISYTNESILSMFDKTTKFIQEYYQDIEVIEGTKRIRKELVPIVALREAIANAIIHRDYLILTGIQIALFDNRIEIMSPGGLPDGMTEELYYQGLTSLSRNPIISYVFYRLGYIERFGTGVKELLIVINHIK